MFTLSLALDHQDGTALLVAEQSSVFALSLTFELED